MLNCRSLSTSRAKLYVMNNMRMALGTQCINISKVQATIDWIGARLHYVSVNLLYIIISLFYFSRYSRVIWKCVVKYQDEFIKNLKINGELINIDSSCRGPPAMLSRTTRGPRTPG